MERDATRDKPTPGLSEMNGQNVIYIRYFEIPTYTHERVSMTNDSLAA